MEEVKCSDFHLGRHFFIRDRKTTKSTLKYQFPIKKFGRFNKKHYLCTHQNPPSLSTMLKCAGRFIFIRWATESPDLWFLFISLIFQIIFVFLPPETKDASIMTTLAQRINETPMAPYTALLKGMTREQKQIGCPQNSNACGAWWTSPWTIWHRTNT